MPRTTTRAWLIAFATAAVLSSCQAPPVAKIVCPTLRDFSPDFAVKLGDEVEDASRANAYPRMRIAVRDWIAIRDQVRACEAGK